MASSSERSSLYLIKSVRLIASRGMLRMDWKRPTYRFSRKVLPLTIFLPMALAFQAQYEPEGST